MSRVVNRQTRWRLVTEAASPSALRVDPRELAPGQRVRTDVRLSVPVAQVLNLSGINFLARETWAQSLAPHGVEVDRVYAANSRTVTMEGTVTGTPLVPIIGAIAALLTAIAFLIIVIRFFVSEELLEALGAWLPFGLILIGTGLFLSGWRR